MVISYEKEKPNLSYVRINQNTSPGTGGAIKGYITKGLVSTDPQVGNAGLLHRSLLGNFSPQPPVKTPYWSNGTEQSETEVEKEMSSGSLSQEDVTSTGNEGTVAGAAVTSSSELGAGLSRVVPTVEHPSHAVSPTNFAPTVRITNTVTSNTQAGSMHPELPLQIPSSPQAAPQSAARITVSTGTKRKLEQPSDPSLNCKASRITTHHVVLKTRADIVQENKRLESDNAALIEKNRQLQQKLDLLSNILKDPLKRDLLHARLQRLQPSSCQS